MVDQIFCTRGDIVENTHLVHAAVTDSTGRLLFHLGDPSRITFVRSTAKPAQALAVLETAAIAQFNLTTPDLALMCASHSSEPFHIDRATSMLHRVGCTESDLACGGHPALNESVNRAWMKADYEPTPICNDCSGKHVGMLAAAKGMGVAVEGYHQPDHPVQLHVKRVVEEVVKASASDTDAKVVWATDGCNLPAPALPLCLLASMYAAFALSVDTVDPTDTSDSNTERSRNMARLFNAMTTFPDLVGGTDRFCTLLMSAAAGRLIGKVGADGCYAIGVRSTPPPPPPPPPPPSGLTQALPTPAPSNPPTPTPTPLTTSTTTLLDAHGAIGIAVKIEDGNLDILYATVVEILDQLGLMDDIMAAALKKFTRPGRVNTAGVVIGQVVPDFTLRTTRRDVIEIARDLRRMRKDRI